ncbi:hypothetical protein C9J38_21700 [Photobacterium sp. GB-210]|nr:hypothetical protein C9J38_21700 [Photobacterium sp. GB-210]
MEVISHNQANYCPVYLACILTLEIVNAEERLKITMKNTPYNSQHIPAQAPGNRQGFWSKMARTGGTFLLLVTIIMCQLKSWYHENPMSLKYLVRQSKDTMSVKYSNVNKDSK